MTPSRSTDALARVATLVRRHGRGDSAAGVRPASPARRQNAPHEDRRAADGVHARRGPQPRRPPRRLIAEAAASRRAAGGAARVLLPDGPARRRQARHRRGAGRRPDPAMLSDSGARSTGCGWSAARCRCAARRLARVLNSCCVFAPDGSLAARYDKIHLFAFDNGRERYDEGRTLERRQPAGGGAGRPAARGPVDLLRPALPRAVPRADGAALRPARACRRPSPTPPARRTGSCCCAPARSRTSATCSRRPGRHARERPPHLGPQPDGRPLGRGRGGAAEGEGVVIAELDPRASPRCARSCRRWRTGGCSVARGRCVSAGRTSSAAPARLQRRQRLQRASRRPRTVPRPGQRQVKLRARKSVVAMVAQRSGRAAHSTRRSAASTGRSRSAARRPAHAASRRPRFRPWPATGCSVCAALPMRTVRRAPACARHSARAESASAATPPACGRQPAAGV
jgi:hypothetical protein